MDDATTIEQATQNIKSRIRKFKLDHAYIWQQKQTVETVVETVVEDPYEDMRQPRRLWLGE
jgi:uncharacterized protein YhjY with autotransporter beta-barrel domain